MMLFLPSIITLYIKTLSVHLNKPFMNSFFFFKIQALNFSIKCLFIFLKHFFYVKYFQSPFSSLCFDLKHFLSNISVTYRLRLSEQFSENNKARRQKKLRKTTGPAEYVVRTKGLQERKQEMKRDDGETGK